MELLSKSSPEYISNGHYLIGDEDFMSVWTFKNKHNLPQKSENPNEGKELSAQCSRRVATKPDFGNFDMIYVYPVADLEDFYGI